MSGSHRILSLVAALSLFYPIVRATGQVVALPSVGLAAMVLTALNFGLICAIVTARDERSLERLDRWLLAIGLLALGAWGGYMLVQMGGYGTDEAAFLQSATNLLMHGHDPYGANLLPSLSRFAVGESFWTYTMSGGVVSTLGYPAFPLVFTAPFVVATHNGQAVPIADLVALTATTGLTYAALPRRWRSLAVLMCVAVPLLPALAIAGDNVVIMIAALTIVARRWRATGAGGALGRAGTVKACALGLALSTNQLAWFIAPFVLVGILLSRRDELGRRPAVAVTARYGAVAAATFLAVNAPFLIWNPRTWVNGVLAPITQHALPYGLGLVDLTALLRVGGGALSAYSYAAACLFVGLLALYALEFKRLARCCFVLPPMALFISGRSLWIYWVALVSVVVVSIATDPDTDSVTTEVASRARRRRRAYALLFAPAAAWVAVALATPAPLTLSILGARSDPREHTVSWLRVEVTNTSGRVVRPHFTANFRDGQASPFWVVRAGPSALAPGARAIYELTGSDLGAMPPNGSPFMLQALTSSPETISSSSTYVQPGILPAQY